MFTGAEKRFQTHLNNIDTNQTKGNKGKNEHFPNSSSLLSLLTTSTLVHAAEANMKTGNKTTSQEAPPWSACVWAATAGRQVKGGRWAAPTNYETIKVGQVAGGQGVGGGTHTITRLRKLMNKN